MGLPLEILAKIGGGLDALKVMREVCKTWQEGFGLGVSQVLKKTIQEITCMTYTMTLSHYSWDSRAYTKPSDKVHVFRRWVRPSLALKAKLDQKVLNSS